MNILASFLSLFFPLCGTQGAAGITPPGVVDFAHLHVQGHSEFLAAPPGFFKQPDQEIAVYDLAPAALFAAVQATGDAQPRTYVLDREPQALQAAYVIRTYYANFPDVFEIAVVPEADGKSGLIVYSHSIYGEGDYGKNRQHVSSWLQALAPKAAS